MDHIRAKIGEGGRIVIPAKYRKILGLKPGHEIIFSVQDVSFAFSRRSRLCAGLNSSFADMSPKA